MLEDFLADLARLPVSELTAVRDVLHSATYCLHLSRLRPAPLPVATVRSLEVMRLGDLRRWLAGRSICLVAGLDEPAAGAGLAARLDGYDLVARFGFDSPEGTGHRTDLMVLGHDQRTGWTQPAQLRLVLADDPGDWVRALRRNLVPGAQRGVVDRIPGRAGSPAHADGPAGFGSGSGSGSGSASSGSAGSGSGSTGSGSVGSGSVGSGSAGNAVELARLLDQLDVNPVIDLIGFTGLLTAGPDGTLSEADQNWLRPRIQRSDDDLVGLR